MNLLFKISGDKSAHYFKVTKSEGKTFIKVHSFNNMHVSILGVFSILTGHGQEHTSDQVPGCELSNIITQCGE